MGVFSTRRAAGARVSPWVARPSYRELPHVGSAGFESRTSATGSLSCRNAKLLAVAFVGATLALLVVELVGPSADRLGDGLRQISLTPRKPCTTTGVIAPRHSLCPQCAASRAYQLAVSMRRSPWCSYPRTMVIGPARRWSLNGLLVPSSSSRSSAACSGAGAPRRPGWRGFWPGNFARHKIGPRAPGSDLAKEFMAA